MTLAPGTKLGSYEIHSPLGPGPRVAFIVNDQKDRSRNFDGVFGTRGFFFEEIAFDFEHQTFSWKP